MAIPTTLALAILVQATPQPASTDLFWMAGYWLDCAGGREVSETWSDPRAGLSVGQAVTISPNGQVSFEASHIAMTPKGLTYFAQPGGAPPTLFPATEQGPSRVVFFNPDNDFPHRVIYERTGETLKARIEGIIEGEERAVEWNFTAAPLNTRCPIASAKGN